MTSYEKAQIGITQIKSAIYEVLKENPNGLKNVDIGKKLGIYTGHIEADYYVCWFYT